MADRIGAYEVLGEIDRGSLDSVYKAFSKETGKIVAVKAFTQEDSRSLEHTQDELDRLKEAKCSRLTQYYESFVHEGHLYVVSDNVEGCTVKEILKGSGGLGETYIAILLKELLLALSFLHENNRFHGEVRGNA
jgi:serine/threonine-protein kinase 24/25/MST4